LLYNKISSDEFFATAYLSYRNLLHIGMNSYIEKKLMFLLLAALVATAVVVASSANTVTAED